jgi:hypothetical protein
MDRRSRTAPTTCSRVAGSSTPPRASGLRRHDWAVGDAGETVHEVPRVPASAGALLFDAQGRLLVLKPSYKRGWTIPGGQLEGISLQAGEILECRLVELDEAARLLSGPVRRRVLAAVGTDRCLYLEDGRPVDSVRA